MIATGALTRSGPVLLSLSDSEGITELRAEAIPSLALRVGVVICMRVQCRCGQEFNLRGDGLFPRKVHCFACGQFFNVLDDGSILQATSGKAAASQVDSSAVQAKPVLVVTPPTPAAAICTEATKDNLEMSPSDEAKLEADLKLVDYLWKHEREHHSLLPFFLGTLLPTKRMSLFVGLTFLAVWIAAFGVGISEGTGLWLCPWSVGLLMTILLPMHIYRKAHAYEQAEATWQRKRVMAIAKHTPKRLADT
jgi:hypothetical protein